MLEANNAAEKAGGNLCSAVDEPPCRGRLSQSWKRRGLPIKRMDMRFFPMLLPLLLVAGSAWSEQLGLHPPESGVELRAYGFGLIPFDGRFTRFQGRMQYNPSNMNQCDVMLQIEAASLTMSNEAIRNQIVGADMMNVAQFPELAFRGACHGAQVSGELTMHGETHPVTLDYTRSGGTVIATGRLQRADWGITGSPLIGGSIIRIRVVLPDPFGARHA
jgi:polyisoprenoid-binding protein YceI